MAGDWIKLEHGLPDKAEVDIIATDLGIDHDSAVGKLIRFWMWADSNTTDGYDISVTSALLDRITFATGFAKAMVKAGWLHGESGNYSIPNFGYHNGETSKQRALSAKRMAKSRAKSCAADATNPQPEKRREEKRRGGGEEEPAPLTLDFEKPTPEKFNPNRMATFEQVLKFGQGQMPPVSQECCEGFFDRMEADG